MTWRSIVLAFALALATSSWCAAQTRVDLGPVVGLYAPTSSVFAYQPSPIGPLGAEATFGTGVAIGGEAVVWFSRHLGAGLLGATGATSLKFAGFAPTGHVVIGAGAAFWRVPFANEQSDLRIGAGVAYLKHTGSAFKPFGSPSNLAGFASFGTYRSITRSIGVELSLNACLYNLLLTEPGTGSPPPPSRFQVDLLGRVGLIYQLRVGHHHG